MDKIDHFEDLRCSLFELGKWNKEYGAKINYFGVVKAAFILSIQYELKEECNETLKWRSLIILIIFHK